MWRDRYHSDLGLEWDDPQVWAHEVDTNILSLNGLVRPIIGSPGTVVVGDVNGGDVQWLLDFDPAPGGTLFLLDRPEAPDSAPRPGLPSRPASRARVHSMMCDEYNPHGAATRLSPRSGRSRTRRPSRVCTPG